MEGIVAILKAWQLHPLADHFTIAILTVAVLVDLVTRLFSTRLWLSYMALTLTIIGALAAVCSYFTGGLEAERLGDSVSGPAMKLLGSHARLGQYLVYAFAALALWRIGLQAFRFLSGSRMIYETVAIVALAALLWQVHTGDQLLFTYGVGTQSVGGAAAPAATSAEPGTVVPAPPASSVPTVFVPSETPTPAAPSGKVQPAPTPSAAPTPTPSAHPSVSVSPTAAPPAHP